MSKLTLRDKFTALTAQVLAQGYCKRVNAKKELDADLINAMSDCLWSFRHEILNLFCEPKE